MFINLIFLFVFSLKVSVRAKLVAVAERVAIVKISSGETPPTSVSVSNITDL